MSLLLDQDYNGRKPETYLGSFEITLAHRIKETIDMFEEGLARWFAHEDQRVTFTQRRSYKVIKDALLEAKNDRARFCQMHKDVPGVVLADLFEVSPPSISNFRSRKLGK